VAVLLGRESKFKQALQHVLLDTNAGVLDFDCDGIGIVPAYTQKELAASVDMRLQCMTRIAQQVAEDLDQLVTIQCQRRERLVFAPDDAVEMSAKWMAYRVVKQFGRIDGFRDAAAA
jgi:hypothetical protein